MIYGIYKSIAGTYYDSLITGCGSDSVHSTLLTVNLTYSITDPAIAICNGDSVSIYGTFRSVAGTYYDSLTTINSCDSVYSTVLTVNPIYNITDPAIDICNGDSVSIYGIFISVAGIYYDSSTTVNNCDSIISTTLTVNPLPLKPTIIQNGNNLASSGAVAYQWYYYDTLISSATSQFYTAVQSGFYLVMITDVNGCSSRSDPVYVDITAVKELTLLNNISIYPNPNTGELIVEITNYGLRIMNCELRLYNILGDEIIKFKIVNQKSKIDLSAYAKGIYTLKIISNEGVINKKIIVE